MRTCFGVANPRSNRRNILLMMAAACPLPLTVPGSTPYFAQELRLLGSDCVVVPGHRGNVIREVHVVDREREFQRIECARLAVAVFFEPLAQTGLQIAVRRLLGLFKVALVADILCDLCGFFGAAGDQMGGLDQAVVSREPEKSSSSKWSLPGKSRVPRPTIWP